MQCFKIAADGPPVREQERYAALIENLFEGIVICEAIRNAEGRVADYWLRYANPTYIRAAPEGQAQVGKRMLELRPGTGPAWFMACERALEGRPVRFEFEETRVGRWYEVHMMRVSDTEFAQLFIDVTGRKAAERRQADLLHELNHRVKNNLTVVSAILELQARSASPEVREHLARAVDRVQSIALLHELLYRQESADHVDLAAYLKQLAGNLEHSLLAPLSVKLQVTCEPLQCPVRLAVNIGLIVNELVTNAAKYAYGEAGGVVYVRAAPEDGRLWLAVSDDGQGFPAEPSTGRQGLGLRLVRSLADGLGGQVTVGQGGGGGRVEVSLPLSHADQADTAQQKLL